MKPKTLGGNVCIRQGEELDFCWRQAVESLLPICEEVVVCDSDSTDGTTEAIKEWAAKEPKIKYFNYPFTKPNNDGMWIMDWTNWAREKLTTEMHFQLDADEVLHENAYEQINLLLKNPKPFSVACHRYNFWKDAQHVIPEGICCATKVLRIAPTNLWLPADVPHPKGQDAMNLEINCPLQIMHYGFLRRKEAFFKKEKHLQTAFTGSYDKKLDAAEKHEGNFMVMDGFVEWKDRILKFEGTHPRVAIGWLRERGYEVT